MRGPEQAIAARAPRPIVGFVAAFAGVFSGLALLKGPGPWFVRAHVALGNALLPSHLDSGVALRLEASTSEPWQALLNATSAVSGARIEIPIDLRGLLYLPLAAFVALVIASPLGPVRAYSKLLAIGLGVLELLLLALIAVPLLAFLGGTGPVQAFVLGRATLVALQIAYRALVAPPGMTYALPLFVWWVLSRRHGGRELRGATRDSGGPREPEQC
jgi:hypothetical protein